MKSNYNDIVDIILTLTEDEEIRKNVAIGGSIVPYLIINKESEEYHPDLYIYVKEKYFSKIREKLKKLTKKYQMDIISDATKSCRADYGFKIKYEDTMIGFFPYSLIDNKLTIKTFRLDVEKKLIKLKTKEISGVSKSSVIRSINFGDKAIRIISPEFILAEREATEKTDYSEEKECMHLLKKISDSSVLKQLRESISNMKVDIESKRIKEGTPGLSIAIIALLIILIVIAYICIKK